MKRLNILVCLLILPVLSIQAQNADIDLLRSINLHRDKSLDPSFIFISNSVTPLSIGVPVLMLTHAYLRHSKTEQKKAIYLAESAIAASIITTTLKLSIQRTRPYTTYPDIEKAGTGGSYSFPSGHTSAAFALATSLSIYAPKWYVITPAYVWAGTVAYSRMDLGVHYPSDVLAGAIIGSGTAYLCHRLNQTLFHSQSSQTHSR